VRQQAAGRDACRTGRSGSGNASTCAALCKLAVVAVVVQWRCYLGGLLQLLQAGCQQQSPIHPGGTLLLLCRYHCNLNILLGKLRSGGGTIKWADVAAVKAELEAQVGGSAMPATIATTHVGCHRLAVMKTAALILTALLACSCPCCVSVLLVMRADRRMASVSPTVLVCRYKRC
jgi:hypothetical protein